ncbi:MAG TPA: GFA family protein [Caulobacteraceae bacterium]|jgi:hypothetical protein|nr:GFA family protein [Caulobacteraceae bacterium]
MTRTATCSCGQLRLTAPDGPVRTSVCHCFACQKRTGSVFGVQARFPREKVSIVGEARVWRRVGEDAGTAFEFRFCPNCGSTVWFTEDDAPDLIAVAVGAFADPDFPAPLRSYYEIHRHPWVALPYGI